MGKSNGCKVCITGGAGYIGSWLVKKLLEKGYTVHATLRNLDDVSKVSLLKSLPDSDERLVLFEADFYNPVTFEQAIEGCEFVFHVATPLLHSPNSQYMNTTEAAIAGAKSIVEACLKSGTVRRLIYTASVVAASPLKEDGSGFKDFMDETCWTPLDLTVACSNDFLKDYEDSKTLAEKEILSYVNHNKRSGLEIVSLACGLVGGDSLPSFTPVTVACLVSQLTNSANEYNCLRFLEELLGKIPIVHIDDVCDAHIFCMESPSINGRFLCTRSYVSSAQIASYYQQYYPELEVKQECLDLPKRQIGWGSTKLSEEGFVYKYDTKMILDDCITSARRWGCL
ncbi:NADPH HC-toxin reductase 1-like [Rosa rugosa]|uniref:NADPH HC-toxin reductase 1-like n=1 Tax=Rosa rugosa TaxID=74645 RepID=UPI002B404F71|nr:NADPH HC-toxin reductase 1-like [Rosa rugosa]